VSPLASIRRGRALPRRPAPRLVLGLAGDKEDIRGTSRGGVEGPLVAGGQQRVGRHGRAPAEVVRGGGERDAGAELVLEEPLAVAATRDALDDGGARAAEEEAAGHDGGGLRRRGGGVAAGRAGVRRWPTGERRRAAATIDAGRGGLRQIRMRGGGRC
jgi:hypothetical protein